MLYAFNEYLSVSQFRLEKPLHLTQIPRFHCSSTIQQFKRRASS